MTEPHTSQHEPSTGLWDAAYRWLFDTSFESGYARLIENSTVSYTHLTLPTIYSV